MGDYVFNRDSEGQVRIFVAMYPSFHYEDFSFFDTNIGLMNREVNFVLMEYITVELCCISYTNLFESLGNRKL